MKILTSRGYRDIALAASSASITAGMQAIIDAARLERQSADMLVLRLSDLPPAAPNRLLGAYINADGDAV